MKTRTAGGLLALVALLGACDDGGGAAAPTPDAAVADQGGLDAAADACLDCPDGRVVRVVDFGPPAPPDAGPDGGLRDVDDTCPDLYRQDLLPVFQVEIDPAEWEAMRDEFLHPREREAAGLPLKPYHPLRTFRYGDEIVGDAMIRLKANPHFAWVEPKMQFVISFREYDRSKRFHGLRKINLDAPWYDRSIIRERVALSFLREAGLPAACANNAVLIVNGQMYGLYVNKEHVDKEFLERNFEDPEGNLYKYGQELKTNEAEADVSRRDALYATRTLEELETFIDRRQMLGGWAGEAMLPHRDGYWCCNHNFYLYDEPGRGFVFIPHDMDITFDSTPLTSPDPQLDPVGTGRPDHFRLAMADRAWREEFIGEIARMLPAYDPAELRRRVDFYARQTAQAFAADPNLPFEKTERGPALQAMRDFFAPRREYLEGVVERGLACRDGETEGDDRDRDGHGACVDCDDFNRQVHPGAADGCNQRDDDCDGRVDEDEICRDCVEVAAPGGRYALCAAPQAWFDGHGTCARQGGTYGIPVSAEDREAIAAVATTLEFTQWWIGANDGGEDGRFVDLVGRTVADIPWTPGQPNGDSDQNCAAIDVSQGGTWLDEECLVPLPVVCLLP
ncbi:MAG: CotH kinase family protein [bacterium]